MFDRESYDFIIIGAGTAGCILASRLLQNTKATVLVLEAGIPNHDPLYHIPNRIVGTTEEFYPAVIAAGTLITPTSEELDGRKI